MACAGFLLVYAVYIEIGCRQREGDYIMTKSLRQLRKIAKSKGVRIEADRDDYGWGYWLLKADDDDEFFNDDNFCSDRGEVEYKLEQISKEGN